VSSERDVARDQIVTRQEDEMKEMLLSHAGEPANKVVKMKKKLQQKHEKGKDFTRFGVCYESHVKIYERERERLSVLIRFSPFYIGDAGLLSTTPRYFAARLYWSAVTL